jgi:hypothetical protein
MTSLVFVLGASLLCLYFALGTPKCLEFSIDVRYTHEQFLFRWNWKSDRVYVAEIGMAVRQYQMMFVTFQNG